MAVLVVKPENSNANLTQKSAVVDMLIMKGADLNAVDTSGNSVLHCAAYIGSGSLIKDLLNAGANLNAKNENGVTPLLKALVEMQTNIILSRYKEYEMAVNILIDEGADLEIKESEYGWNPLHQAAFIGSASIIKNLLNAGANLNAKTRSEQTPLLIALTIPAFDL